jgi:hypothetical protein
MIAGKHSPCVMQVHGGTITANPFWFTKHALPKLPLKAVSSKASPRKR